MHPEAPEGFFKTLNHVNNDMSKKKSQLNSIILLPKTTLRFIKEAKDELKKVTWPSRQTTVRYTVIVIVSSIAVGFVIGGVDYLLSLILERVI